MAVRLVSIGDSFTEGVGDEVDGEPRGWADLVAYGWAKQLDEPVEYANLAVRGRLIHPIVGEQLDQALALKPTHITFNGGGNDMLRWSVKLDEVADLYTQVYERCRAENVHLVVLSGPNPIELLPFGNVFDRRGSQLVDSVIPRFVDKPGATLALPWCDHELRDQRFWADDRLHLNAAGHHRVAAIVLDALGVRSTRPGATSPRHLIPARHRSAMRIAT